MCGGGLTLFLSVLVSITASGNVSDLSTQAKCAIYSYTYLFIDWM